MKNTILLSTLVITSLRLFAQPVRHDQARALVAQMTLREKAHLVVGMGMNLPGVPAGQGGPVVGVTEDKVPGAAGTTFAIPRLNLSAAIMADGPAGVRIAPARNEDSSRTFYCTAFPIGTLLASSWDTSLLYKVGAAMGSELKEYGMDVLLAPALNIHRNPLGGRNFEYYSEDPIVSGIMATAMVRGIESNGVGTSVKHFVANNQETNRNQVNTIVSERALREIYLRGFEIVVKNAQPWTVMSSYNRLNGTYTSESEPLLNTILRKEWGYLGMVMTDWFGGKDAVAQMKAGNDLLMPGTPGQVTDIIKAVQQGQLSEALLDINAIRIVEMILRSPSQQKYPFSNQPDLNAHAQIARQAAAEGMVLLRNNGNTLPLGEKQKSIAVFGVGSYDFIAGGTGSGDVNEAYSVSLAEGLRNVGLQLEEDLVNTYEHHIKQAKAAMPPKKFFFELSPPIDEMPLAAAMLDKAAAQTDIAFISIGRNSGEFQDRKELNDFNLTQAEQTMIRQVSNAFHAKGKKIVVILNIGGVIETASWRNYADAILIAWQAGQEGGNAVADILTGKMNPSGKLATTFPLQYTDVPAAANFPGIELSNEEEINSLGFSMGKPSQVSYEEGIYVGYRYFNSFNKAVAYPFGFGLSYTTFQYEELVLDKRNFDGTLSASITVTNSGTKPGKEVVQFYLSAPGKDMEKPSLELKGFGKTKLLQPGERQTITVIFSSRDLASYDESKHAWVIEKGQYTVSAGGSIAALAASARFEVASASVVEQCNPVLLPQAPVKSWKEPAR